MNLQQMLNLDTPNLLRSVYPQTDTEVALYERLSEAERSLSFYHEAINDYSELGSSDTYPELFADNLAAVIDERDKLKTLAEDLAKRLRLITESAWMYLEDGSWLNNLEADIKESNSLIERYDEAYPDNAND